MKMSPEQIRAVAEMLTDDPDVLVNEDTVTEWFGGGKQLTPSQQRLAAATGINDPRKLQSLEQEFQQFVKYRPSLQTQGEDAAMKAFVTYKKTGKMPLDSGRPQNMDQIGGSEFSGQSPEGGSNFPDHYARR